MLPIILAAAAASTGAEPIVLSEAAQVKELCEALRAQPYAHALDPAQKAASDDEAQQRRRDAAGRDYQVEVPAKGFAFGRYRAKDKLIELDGDRPLVAIEGMLHIDLDGIDDVAFEATPAQVSDWSAAKKEGALKLMVVFRPSGDRCAGSAAAQSWRIAGKARSWQIVGESGAVAAADSDGEPVGGGPREITVDKVALDTDTSVPEDEGRARFGGVRPALSRCGLEAQHSGNLVVMFELRAGRVADPQVVMDSLRDERVAACVSKAVVGAAVAGTGRGTASISFQ
jgi:hypothetical protein